MDNDMVKLYMVHFDIIGYIISDGFSYIQGTNPVQARNIFIELMINDLYNHHGYSNVNYDDSSESIICKMSNGDIDRTYCNITAQEI